MKELEEQRVCVKFCCKLGKNFTETFQLLNQACGEDEERVSSTKKKKARVRPSKIKVIFVGFFDLKRIVHHEFVPRGQMVNKQLYSCTIRTYF
jgi:hypothetical protein